jgi:ABC-2 type transport system permease protein
MRNIWTIAKREYIHYFISPIAYVVAFAILGVLGFLFFLNLQYYIQNAVQSFGSAPDATPITGAFVFLLVTAIPVLTMRLVSDENRMGTMELMLTAPIRDSEWIIGKWLGGFLFILTITLITLIYPLILNNLVTPGIDQLVLLSSYLGVILISAAFLGIGVGISAIFSNQIAAFIVTWFTLLILWFLIGFPANILPVGSSVFQYLDASTHFESLNRGIINLSDIVYLISLTALGLFTGITAVDIRRWR